MAKGKHRSSLQKSTTRQGKRPEANSREQAGFCSLLTPTGGVTLGVTFSTLHTLETDPHLEILTKGTFSSSVCGPLILCVYVSVF